MTTKEAIINRHSVRKYTDKKISEQTKKNLQIEIDTCNKEGNLDICLVTEDKKSFGGFFTHYGRFSKVSNFIILSGKSSNDLKEKLGYYGERLVITAQMMGLNTCWVAATFNKRRCNSFVKNGNELVGIITIGYNDDQGVMHKSKSIDMVNNQKQNMPEWFKNGVDMALLAPTGMNKQNFKFDLEGSQVKLETFDSDYADIDKGILKYHFEVGAGIENFSWSE